MAIAQVKEHIKADGKKQYNYYISKTVLNNPQIQGQTLNGSYWMLFVDQMPGANWEHPCKYAFVSTTDKGGISCVVDSVCPPSDIDLTRCDKNIRTQASNNLERLIIPQKHATYSTSSPHTYAIIINGGRNRISNGVRFWNDCSFIYNTLTKAYNVPKENIKVLMSDGTDAGEDLNIGDITDAEFISSPLDLDGDGLPDINQPCNKQSLELVTKDFANKLSDDDHLFVFVTDHGGITTNNGIGKSYVCLWGGENVYADDFSEYFKNINAGYITFVMGQCYSGGFTKYLEGNNRIILTACKENEKSYGNEDVDYEEFLFHFTSYMNGFDPFGNKIHSEDAPTLKDAFEYAKVNDVYYKGHKLGKETPTLSILENSTAEELTLENVPPVVDICIDNSDVDKKFEIWNNKNLSIKYFNETDDEITLNKKGNENVTPSKISIELKLYNHGVKDYTANSVFANVCGYKASITGTPVDITQNEDLRDFTAIVPLDKEIKAGEHITKVVQIDLDKRNNIFAGKENFIATISDNQTKEGSIRTRDLLSDYSKIAIRHLFELKHGTPNNISFYSPIIGKSYRIEVEEDPANANPLFEVAELTLFNDENDYDIRNSDIQLSDNISKAFVRRGIRIDGKSDISGIIPNRTTPDSLSIECNFYSSPNTDSAEYYKFYLSAYNGETDELLSREVFEATRLPRKEIILETNFHNQNGTDKYAAVDNVSEEVTCEWFNSAGDFIGEGYQTKVTNSGKAENLTVIAKSTEDGAIASSKCLVNYSPIVSSIKKDASRQLIILGFRNPVEIPLQLSVTPVGFETRTTVYDIKPGDRSVSFSYTSLGTQTYAISILNNGKVMESHKFTI